MADVYPGLGDYLATSDAIDLGPALDEAAGKILTAAQGLAAEHAHTGAYASSLHIEVDETSPSRRDRLVVADDPAAVSIEWGHVAHTGKDDDGTGTHVPGQHILGRAADSIT